MIEELRDAMGASGHENVELKSNLRRALEAEYERRGTVAA